MRTQNIITEEEKRRILNMHQTRSKNHYLIEQDDLINKYGDKFDDTILNEPEVNVNENIQNCDDLMEMYQTKGTKDNPIFGEPTKVLELGDGIKVSTNDDKSKMTFIKNNKPFCYVNVKEIGDCGGKIVTAGGVGQKPSNEVTLNGSVKIESFDKMPRADFSKTGVSIKVNRVGFCEFSK
jgi:hypothetical protein